MQPQDHVQSDEDDTQSSDLLMVGEYANYASVGSTQTEFYLDFFHVVPGAPESGQEQVLPVRRILISPMLVRGIVRALEEEITSYESTYHITLPMVDA